MMMLRSVVCGWQQCEVLIARASGRRRCSLCDDHGDGYESDDEHDVGNADGNVDCAVFMLMATTAMMTVAVIVMVLINVDCMNSALLVMLLLVVYCWR